MIVAKAQKQRKEVNLANAMNVAEEAQRLGIME